MGEEEAPQSLQQNTNGDSDPFKLKSHKRWWIEFFTYGFLVIASGAAGTILSRLYFNNGGNSVWTVTLAQFVLSPFVVPIRCLTILRDRSRRRRSVSDRARAPPSPFVLAAVYVGFGVYVAVIVLLYTIGLQYVPVTTYSLICTSQLAFNAVFSYFINRQKLTPYIINSLVILTISTVLLVFQNDPGDSVKSSPRKYAIGFLCTLGGCAGSALGMAVTRLVFTHIVKEETLGYVVDMSIGQSTTAAAVVTICFMVSGDWRKARGEMLGFDLGKSAYVLVLTWMAVTNQIFSIGCIGLIYKVSALFSNVITVVGLPVAPVMAVVFLKDTMTGLKAVVMVLAIWGFVSYMYQQYIDDLERRRNKKEEKEVGEEGGREGELARESG